MHKTPLLINLLTTEAYKNKGKENSSGHIHKNTSQTQKHRPKKLPPMMQSMMAQPYNLIMESTTNNE